MSTEGGSYIIYIYKPNAWLAYDERICWWVAYPFRNVRLKVNNAGMSKVKVVSPPGYDRIRFNSFMPLFLKEGEKRLSHFTEVVAFAHGWFVDESVRITPLWCWFSTVYLIRILRPKILLTNLTLLSNIHLIIKKGNVILTFWETLQSTPSNKREIARANFWESKEASRRRTIWIMHQDPLALLLPSSLLPSFPPFLTFL